MIGLSTNQKVTAALCQLAYGYSADSIEEYVRIGQSTALKAFKLFTSHIVQLYGPDFLRPPNPEELTQIMNEYEDRGFPGCKGSIDGMHWVWKNCPTAWAGHHQGKEGTPTVILEAVASKNLRIWHAFFGCPGALNDINVVQRSPVFNDFLNGM